MQGEIKDAPWIGHSKEEYDERRSIYDEDDDDYLADKADDDYKAEMEGRA